MMGNLSVAIAGEFQRGKSTLANALLGRNAAEKGRGKATTHENRSFALTPQVTLVDTPGFDANGKDSETALEALKTADVFLYVHESKELGDACAGLFQLARETGKIVLFLLNCRDFAKWAPEENGDVAATIEAELRNTGIARNVLASGKRLVTPINALWACYGLGLLNPASKEDVRDMRKTRRYAEDDLSIPGAAALPEEVLRAEMLRRSGVREVREWLTDLPVRRLQDVLENPGQSLERILDQFAESLKRRWFAA